MPLIGGLSEWQSHHRYIALSLEICYNPHGDREQHRISDPPAGAVRAQTWCVQRERKCRVSIGETNKFVNLLR